MLVFPSLLNHVAWFPVHPIFAASLSFAAPPIGNGAFQLRDAHSPTELVLVKSATYWMRRKSVS